MAGGGDLQELGQAVVIGLIFAFLVAKLISVVIAFKEDNHRLTHTSNLSTTTTAAAADVVTDSSPLLETQGDGDDDDDDDDDDWEGIESTELDEEFSAASAFVASAAAARVGKVPEDKQLQLYGFYKIATEGPCTAQQPSPLKMKARAKWNAWHKLGAIPPEEAMQKYITVVNELFPTWASGSSARKKDEDAVASSSDAKGSMGPVFSSFLYEEEEERLNELDLDDIHISAREGAADDVIKHMNSGVSVNLRDSEGRTPLHWAVDRGHLDVVEILVNSNADVNAQDHEGQTPLHYAVLCERKDIAEFLVKHHADGQIKDEDANIAQDLSSTDWSFLTTAN